jgi:spore germination protein Q
MKLMDNNQYQYAIPYPSGNVNTPYPPIGNMQQNTPPLPNNQMYNGNNPYQQPYNKPLTTSEESYIENIIRLNRGKLATFYLTYSDSNEWRDRVYKGVIEAAGVDHIIISDPRDGKRYILLNIYLDWVEFNEEINYDYPIR